jgi:predicted metal-binding membrane protein
MSRSATVTAAPRSQAGRWERGLLAALAGLSALAWLATWRWPMPGIRTGVLTGSGMRDMGNGGTAAPMALGLFLLTWVVMMTAMMLPAAAPVVLAVDRWARRSGRSRLAAAGFLTGYLADWSVAGLGAYAVLAGLEHRYPSPGLPAVRAGAVLLAVAGLWQLTPVKHACLRRCRSPLAFLAANAARLSRGRLGTVQTGIRHGAFCLGCCWSLMLVLVLLGMMNLAWMALVAAVVSAERLLPSGRIVAATAAAALIASGAVLFAVPHLLTA